jgi:UDP-N-acetylglucosamine 1-carboxyvinyltransferase
MTAKDIAASEKGKIALGTALRELRRHTGITQVELAERANTDDTYISHLEHGRIDIKWSTLERVLRALGFSLNDLVAEINKRTPR